MAFLFWHSLKLAPARTSKGGIQLRPAINNLSSLPPRLSWTSRNDTLILNRPTTLEVRAAKQGAVVYILVAFRERERVVQMRAVSPRERAKVCLGFLLMHSYISTTATSLIRQANLANFL